MAGMSAPGVGSGLDVNTIVTQLVAAERAPAEQRITRTQSGIDTKLSALGVMRGVLSTLQSSVGALRTESNLLARKAESSDTTILKASAVSSAPAGTYSVEVLSLATTHKLVSKAYAGGSSAEVGTGTLTFAQNGKEFSVEATDGMTLAQLRDALSAPPTPPVCAPASSRLTAARAWCSPLPRRVAPRPSPSPPGSLEAASTTSNTTPVKARARPRR